MKAGKGYVPNPREGSDAALESTSLPVVTDRRGPEGFHLAELAISLEPRPGCDPSEIYFSASSARADDRMLTMARFPS